MGSFSRKVKRAQAKAQARKLIGNKQVKVSICPDHGSYLSDDLCACYDKGGLHEGKTHDDVMMESFTRAFEGVVTGVGGLCTCPIHGQHGTEKPTDLCACYDSNGKLKPDWNKGLNS